MVALAPSVNPDGIWSCKWPVLSSKPLELDSGLGPLWTDRPNRPSGAGVALVQGLVSNRDSGGLSCQITVDILCQIKLEK